MVGRKGYRRNLSPIQRIAIAEKYRSIYEKQAKEKQGTRNDLLNNITPNSVESKTCTANETNTRLAKVAGVGTVARFNKVVNSDDEELKKKVMSGDNLKLIFFLKEFF